MIVLKNYISLVKINGTFFVLWLSLLHYFCLFLSKLSMSLGEVMMKSSSIELSSLFQRAMVIFQKLVSIPRIFMLGESCDWIVGLRPYFLPS